MTETSYSQLSDTINANVNRIIEKTVDKLFQEKLGPSVNRRFHRTEMIDILRATFDVGASFGADYEAKRLAQGDPAVQRAQAIDAERAERVTTAHADLCLNARSRDRYFCAAELPFVVDDVKHVTRMFQEGKELWRALAVLVLDSRSRGWLEVNDPKALEQARRALGDLPRDKD